MRPALARAWAAFSFMKELTKLAVVSRVLAIKQAAQTVNRTLAICEPYNVFTDARRAELQACAVILRRAEADLWSKYESLPT